jgi:hypothetical protein
MATTANGTPYVESSDLVANYPATSLALAEHIDDVAPSSWEVFTPTYTAITVGNGTVTAKYAQHGKTIVGYWKFVLGSTSAIGTAPTITLPVTASSTALADTVIGTGSLADTGTVTYLGLAAFASTTTFSPKRVNTGTGFVTVSQITATVPFTWTTTDVIYLNFQYEAA